MIFRLQTSWFCPLLYTKIWCISGVFSYRRRIWSSVPCGRSKVVVATMISCVYAGNEHTDLRQEYQHPDATRTAATMALCGHGNCGAVSAADTNVDNQQTSTSTNNKRITTNFSSRNFWLKCSKSCLYFIHKIRCRPNNESIIAWITLIKYLKNLY